MNKSDFTVGQCIGDFIITRVYSEAFRSKVDAVCHCGYEKTFRIDSITPTLKSLYHSFHDCKIDHYPVGMVINDMTIIKHCRITDSNSIHTRPAMVCKCNICGRERTLRPDSLGITSFDHSVCGKNNYGGLSCGEYGRFYGIWNTMVSRCTNLNDHNYLGYGAKGITTEYDNNNKGYLGFFNDFYQSYIDHVGDYGEDQTTLDRIDNFGGYYKDNLRWATRQEQSQNQKRMTKQILCIDPEGNGYITNNQSRFAMNHPPLSRQKISLSLNYGYLHNGWRFIWMYSTGPDDLFIDVSRVGPIRSITFELY